MARKKKNVWRNWLRSGVQRLHVKPHFAQQPAVRPPEPVGPASKPDPEAEVGGLRPQHRHDQEPDLVQRLEHQEPVPEIWSVI